MKILTLKTAKVKLWLICTLSILAVRGGLAGEDIHPVVLGPSSAILAAGVEVYDVSDDASGLSVSNHHIIIKRGEDFIHVSEYMRLKNSSARAKTWDKVDDQNRPVALAIMLPEGYKKFHSLRYFRTDALVFTDDGFYDTAPVAPGEYDVEFSYTLAIDAETMDFVKKLSLPTDKLMLFTVLPVARAVGVGSSRELTMADGAVCQYYSLGPRQVGEELAFQLSGFELPESDSSWIIMAVVFAGVFVIALIRLRSKN